MEKTKDQLQPVTTGLSSISTTVTVSGGTPKVQMPIRNTVTVVPIGGGRPSLASALPSQPLLLPSGSLSANIIQQVARKGVHLPPAIQPKPAGPRNYLSK